MNLKLAQRLRKLEEKYATERLYRCISRIVWMKANDIRRPGLVWVPDPDPKEPVLQLSLDFKSFGGGKEE